MRPVVGLLALVLLAGCDANHWSPPTTPGTAQTPKVTALPAPPTPPTMKTSDGDPQPKPATEPRP